MQIPNFLSIVEVKAIHKDQINNFGGATGIRDEGLLESALAQPKAMFDGQFLHFFVHEKAAAYLYHLVMNHPFVDGNKRTAVATMELFLRLNGYDLTLSNEEEYDLVIKVARGEVDKVQLSRQLERVIV